jgi:peptide deformylase
MITAMTPLSDHDFAREIIAREITASEILASLPESLDICQLGHPSLRRGVATITDVQDPRLPRVIDQLLMKVHQANGVGIAAPQVGVNLALLIVASRPTLRYPNAPKMEPTVMINPRIVSVAPDRIKDWEGCLSIPGIRGQVPRHRSMVVAYVDRHGQPQEQTLTDFVARIFQHEYDHLEGKVFLDRVESSLELISEVEYQKRVELGL